MRDDALEFIVVHKLEEPFGDCDGGVVRVTSRGECVGCCLWHDVQLGHRQVSLSGQPLHHFVKPGQLLAGNRLGAAGPERDFIREEIGERVADQGKEQRYGHAVAAAEIRAEGDEQERQRGQ